MKKRYIFLLFFFLFPFSTTAAEQANHKRFNVGLLIVATGKYINFVEPLIESAEKYFCTDHDVTYFVFTDGELQESDSVVRIEQKRLGWPYDTMMRFFMYLKHRDTFKEMDYLFACDADMLFVADVGSEILGDRVATLHPGFVGERGSYERRPASTACVYRHEGEHYFAGGFNGGKTEKFLEMARIVTLNIRNDLVNKIIAVWHDESHINRYYIDNLPTVVLSPSYCYPEKFSTFRQRAKRYLRTCQKKLLALDKNHSEMRK